MLGCETVWKVPGMFPALDEGLVHAWLVRKNSSLAEQDANALGRRLNNVSLSSEQIKRRFGGHAKTVRNILSHYLEVKPSTVNFVYNSAGKPALTNRFRDKGIQFNFSHSGGLALFAIALNTKVGVDLEYKQPMANIAQFVKRFFSRDEIAAFSILRTEDSRRDFFYDHWTAKEAFVKAQGCGLTRARLDKIEITPERSGVFIQSGEPRTKSSRWRLYRLQSIPEFAAALVVKEHEKEVSCWSWPDSGFEL